MAFTFVVETGAGVAQATSYVSTDAADTYFEIAEFAEWAALPDERKEYLLAYATRYLDQKVNWKGYKATTIQGLRWPRTGVYDRDGDLIADDVIPRQLTEITCEVARWLIENDPAAGQDVENMKKIVVDVIEIEYQDQTSQTSIPSLFSDILKGLGVFRVGGRGTAKIIKA